MRSIDVIVKLALSDPVQLLVPSQRWHIETRTGRSSNGTTIESDMLQVSATTALRRTIVRRELVEEAQHAISIQRFEKR